jgi:N-acyl-D-aspartate/D-glutamate deacylase
MPYLCSLHLTPWLRLLGSREALARWLRVEDFRKEVKEALAAGKWFIRVHINPNTNPRWAENILVVKHKQEEYSGKTLAEVAEMRRRDPLDTLFDLIAEDPEARGATRDYRISEEYVKLFFKHPACMVGVDVTVFDDKYQMRSPPYSIPTINTYAAYPSFITRYVREQHLITLEEAIRKCASLPAEVYSLRDRGLLKEGYYADIVLLDLERLRVAGDLLEPRRYPEGVEYVIVNGSIVVERGKHTGVRTGRILKREVD